jgi:nucleoid-associated protein EbfC
MAEARARYFYREQPQDDSQAILGAQGSLARLRGLSTPPRSTSRNLVRLRKPKAGRSDQSMDMNKMMQQVQQLQAQMAQAQEELKNETVEASAGGGMVTVKATGDLQITEIKISPETIDPDDPELLADMVLAAVNEALRSAQSLAESKLGGMAGLGDMGGLGLPGM